MNLCRILYTVSCGTTGTKKVSAEWVKDKFGSQWNNLIDTAKNWAYGKKMPMRNETIKCIKFVINEIKKTEHYQEIFTTF